VNPSRGRVLGWDLLRGLCALTVASYHLLYWLGLAELPALGTYGVYLFFVLSGASLAFNYGRGDLDRPRQILGFLAARWLRLAPLYVLLCLIFAGMIRLRSGALPSDAAQRLAWNASFAFGADDPAVTALLIGGWSLGIEAMYYLAFPLAVAVLPRAWLRYGVFAALTALQWWWIQRTVGALGWSKAVVAYHQVPAFAAYFFGGCVIGYLRRAQGGDWPIARGWFAWLAMAALLGLLMPAVPGDELLAWRGAILFFACFGVVYVSGRVDVRGLARPLARWLGDITYGTYLLHPMLLFGVLWFGFAAEASDLALPVRVALLFGVLAVACASATASERWFERPLRRLGRSLVARPT
jgi:peptidoglycan/LPS O-acetylase OafA/YrhL